MNAPLNNESIENDAIESVMKSIPLRAPTEKCDDAIINMIRSDQPSTSKKNRMIPASFLVATAAALLIGFCLGTMVKLNLENGGNGDATQGLSSESSNLRTGFGLSDNVEIKRGESKTFIVGDSLQFRNELPVRKVETVTHKKVLVKNKEDQSEREIEIPIHKVFLTPAETI